MSIDAKVKFVMLNEDGTGELRLIDRPGDSGGIAGQRALRFRTCPEEVTALNGREIWGGSDAIMLGDHQIASRDGYTDITFVDRERFNRAVAADR